MNVGLKTLILPAGEAAVATAARCLAEGGLVAFPTETVYGLGADAANAGAIARLYEAKGRPSFNPLIAHVGDIAAAMRIARFDATAIKLAEAFWPGPLTLVLPKARDCAVADLATAGLETIAIRVPAHPIAQAILRAFGGPVVAPSANLSGHVSPTSAAHVQSDLDGTDRPDRRRRRGRGRGRIHHRRVLRGPDAAAAGRAAARRDRARAGPRRWLRPPEDADHGAGQPLAPGMLASHYAPRTPVRLNAASVEDGEALLAFGPDGVPGAEAATAVMNLSPRGDLAEAAANLFGYLRALDTSGRARHRGHAGAASRARRSDQRPAAPRRGGAIRLSARANWRKRLR